MRSDLARSIMFALAVVGSSCTVHRSHAPRSSQPDRPDQDLPAPDGRIPVVQRGHYAEVAALGFDRTGRRLASVGGNELLIWNVPSRAVEARFPFFDGQQSSRRVAWSADGQWLAYASYATITLVDLARGVVSEPIPCAVHGGGMVAFSPVAPMLAAVCADGWSVWDVGSHLRRWSLPAQLESTVNPPLPMDADALWNPDGRFVLARPASNRLVLADAHSGRVVTTFAHGEASVVAAAWSRNGAMLATSADDGVVRVWDVARGNVSQTLTGVAGVRALAFDATSARLAISAEPDDQGVDTWVWTLGTTTRTPGASIGGTASRVEWLPTGDRLLWQQGDTVIVASADGSGERRRFGCEGGCGDSPVAWSMVSNLVAARSESEVRLRDLTSWQSLPALPRPLPRATLVASPDHHVVALSQSDGARVWRFDTGDVILLPFRVDAWNESRSRAIHVDLPNHQWLVADTSNGHVLVRAPLELREFESVPRFAFTADDRYVFGVDERRHAIRVFDAATLRLLRELPAGDSSFSDHVVAVRDSGVIVEMLRTFVDLATGVSRPLDPGANVRTDTPPGVTIAPDRRHFRFGDTVFDATSLIAASDPSVMLDPTTVSPDGRWQLSLGDDHRSALHARRGGAADVPFATFSGGTRDIANWSPDSRRFLTTDGHELQVLDVGTARPVRHLDLGGVPGTDLGIYWFVNGSRCIAWVDAGIHVLDLQTDSMLDLYDLVATDVNGTAALRSDGTLEAGVAAIGSVRMRASRSVGSATLTNAERVVRTEPRFTLLRSFFAACGSGSQR